MGNILVVKSSSRGEESFSNRLIQAILERLAEGDAHLVTRIRDLAEKPMPHLGKSQIAELLTGSRAEEDRNVLRDSDQAIAEVLQADTIVIGVPMYNFSIPSVLKAWIDHIVRAGWTFEFTAEGPVGLVTEMKAYLAIASGGIYSEGPLKANDFTEMYMKTILGFIGITDVSVVRVEGVAVSERRRTALEHAVESIRVA